MSTLVDSGIHLQATGRNQWLLSGHLDLKTVPLAWQHIQPLLSVPGPLVVSLSGITHAKSAALALLLEGLEEARKNGCELNYADLPTELLSLAQMSNCEDILTENHSI